MFFEYWLNQHGKEAMLDMPLWSCKLQQHISADPVNSFAAVIGISLTERDLLTTVNFQKIPIGYQNLDKLLKHKNVLYYMHEYDIG